MSTDSHEPERLLRVLPSPPEAWVRTAQELPFVRDEIESILERAAASPIFRDELERDAPSALRQEGHQLSPDVVAHILRRLPKNDALIHAGRPETAVPSAVGSRRECDVARK